MAGRTEFKTENLERKSAPDVLGEDDYDDADVALTSNPQTPLLNQASASEKAPHEDIQTGYDDADVDLDEDELDFAHLKKQKQYAKIKEKRGTIAFKRNEPEFKLLTPNGEVEETEAEEDFSAEDKNAVPLPELYEPWVQVNTTKSTPGEQNVAPVSCLRANFNKAKPALIVGASIITPLSFAMNSLVGFTNLSLENLSWEEFQKLRLPEQLLAGTSGLSSEVSNFLMNLENIPKAFESVGLLKENFRDNKLKNGAIIILSTGAAIAAAAIGASSFAWAGMGFAAFNACTNGFLYWATRFYGLVNLSKRYEKYKDQGHYEDLLDRLANDPEALTALAKEYTDEFNAFIEREKLGKNLDNAAVYDLLHALVKVMREDPTFKIQKNNCAWIFSMLSWSVAILGALSVVPTFAQKFLDGTQKALEFIKEGTGKALETSDKYFRMVLGTVFGSATPLMYLNGISQLGAALSSSYDALKDPATVMWRKLLSPVIAGMNGLAAMSGHRLTRDVIKNPHYIFKDLTPENSWGDHLNRWLSWFAVMGVNGKFVTSKWLPAPKHVIKRSWESTRRLHAAPSNPNIVIKNTTFGEDKTSAAKVLGYFVQDCSARLKASPLPKDAKEALKRAEGPTPNGQVEGYTNLNSPSSDAKAATIPKRRFRRPDPRYYGNSILMEQVMENGKLVNRPVLRKTVSFSNLSSVEIHDPASPTSPPSPTIDAEQAGLKLPASEIELPLISDKRVSNKR